VGAESCTRGGRESRPIQRTRRRRWEIKADPAPRRVPPGPAYSSLNRIPGPPRSLDPQFVRIAWCPRGLVAISHSPSNISRATRGRHTNNWPVSAFWYPLAMRPTASSIGPAGRHLAYRLATVVRESRKALGWTQTELAQRAKTSQAAISRLESGRIDEIDVGVVGQVMDAFDARVELAIQIPHLSDRERQRDPAHARCVAFVRGRLAAAGWTVHTEVEIVAGRSHGWIDVFALHEPAATTGVFEIKTDIDDIGRLERQIGWYEREAFAAARRLGWQPSSMVSAVLMLDTKRAERRLRENRDVLEHALPVRAREFAAWLAQPTPELRPRGRAFAMIDPLSRRHTWLRPTVLDGRRRPARYEDYADFMRRLEAPRRRPVLCRL